MPEVIVPLASGFEEIEAITVVDLLRRAGIQVTTVSVTNDLAVIGANGVEVRADKTLSAVVGRMYDAMVLPGGIEGTAHLGRSETLCEMIKTHYEKGFWVTAICAAPTVLAKCGLLEGKKATCYPGFEKKMTGATMMTETVVEDGKIITSRGPGTAMAFSLKLIERLVSAEKAEEIKSGVLSPCH